jgi:hypothetical protein
VGELHRQRRCCQGANLIVELCRLIDHEKLHMKHGLGVSVNLALCQGVLFTVYTLSHELIEFDFF